MTRKTRGKTRSGRLDAVNAYVLAHHRDAFAAGDVVDVGCGLGAVTTYEWLESLRAAGLTSPVWAIDSDAARLPEPGRLHVATQMPSSTNIGVVRAMNVLRQYPVDEYVGVVRQWKRALAPMGLLVEGTTDKTGAIATFLVVSRDTRHLVLATDFTRGFGPWMFRDYLPNLWRRNLHEHPDLWSLFSRWAGIHRNTGRDATLPSRFVNSILELRGEGVAIDAHQIERFAYARIALSSLVDPSLGPPDHAENF